MNHILTGPHLHTEAMGPDDNPTEALFRALSRADVEDIPAEIVLYDFVDPDALDRLFGGARARNDYTAVTFEAWNLLVTVTQTCVSLHETVSAETADAHSPTASGQSNRPAQPERERS